MDHNTCVLTTRTLQGAVLDLAVVLSDRKPHVVVSALENAALRDDRVGVRWVVVDNASPALHAALSWSFPSLQGVALDTCHLPMEHEAVASHHGTACSVGQQVQRVLPFRRSAQTRLNPSRRTDRQFTGCRASLPREHVDAAATSMPSGFGPWRLSRLCTPKREKQALPEGKSRLRLLMAAATFQRYQWYLEQCTTPLDGGVPASGPAGHRDMW